MFSVPNHESASFAFSLQKMQLASVQHANLSEDFSTESLVQLYDISNLKISKIAEKSFSASFTCVDFSEQNVLVAGAEQGQVLLCQEPEKLSQAVLIDMFDSDVTSIKFSALQESSDYLIAVGTQKGEIAFMNHSGDMQFPTKNKNNENPHSGAVSAISWNPRVPRVCCSGDTDGNVIVWDHKKKGAIMNFNNNSPVVSALFSTSVATVVIVVTKNHIVNVWDLRNKTTPIQSLSLSYKQDIQDAFFWEGYDDLLGVRYCDGSVESFIGISNGKGLRAGLKSNVGQICSILYPNLWLNHGTANIVTFPIDKLLEQQGDENQTLKPVVFNPKIYQMTMTENDSDFISLFPIKNFCFSNKNRIHKTIKDNYSVDLIIDSQEIIIDAEKIQNGTYMLPSQIQDLASELQLNQHSALIKLLPKNSKGQDDDFYDQKPISNSTDFQFTIIELISCGDIQQAVVKSMDFGDFGMAFYICEKLNFDKQIVVERFIKQNDSNKEIFNIINDVSNLDPTSVDINEYKSALKLVNAYYPNKINLVLSRVLKEKQSISDIEKIDIAMALNQPQVALSTIFESQLHPSLLNKLYLSIKAQENGIYINCQQFDILFKLLESQGAEVLADEFRKKLNVKSVQNQIPLSSSVQHIPNALSQVSSNQITPNRFIPQLPDISMQPIPQQVVQQQIQNTHQIPLVQNRQIQSTGSNVFVPPPVSQPKQISAQSNVIYAVDFTQKQPSQQQQINLQQNPISSNANEVQIFQAQIQDVPLAKQPDIFTNKPLNAFNTRGDKITAPPPPPMNGIIQQSSASHIQVSTSTRPNDYLSINTPQQHLNLMIDPIQSLQQIDLCDSKIATQLLQISLKFLQNDQMAFNKNWQKLGECLICVAESNRNTNLFDQLSLECVDAYCSCLNNGNSRDATAVLTDFCRTNAELYEKDLSKFIGTLKITARSFK